MSVRAMAQMVAQHCPRLTVETVYEIGARRCEDTLECLKEFPRANIFAFECNPDTLKDGMEAIQPHKRAVLFPSAVSDVSGTIGFNQSTTENVGYSSLLEPTGKYDSIEPMPTKRVVVPVTRLDRWIRMTKIPPPDVIWLDCQGSELRALKGLGEYLSGVQAIWTEFALDEMYRGQPLLHDLDAFLAANGLVRRWDHVVLVDPKTGKEWWGDAFYARQFA